MAITLADGRSLSTKILAVIQRSPSARRSSCSRAGPTSPARLQPFAVVKYPLAQVADFAPFGADQFVAV